MLRLAEFLERGRNANVDDVNAFWDDKNLRLTVVAEVVVVGILEALRLVVVVDVIPVDVQRVGSEVEREPRHWRAALRIDDDARDPRRRGHRPLRDLSRLS